MKRNDEEGTRKGREKRNKMKIEEVEGIGKGVRNGNKLERKEEGKQEKD